MSSSDGKRELVNSAALDAFIEYANAERDQADSQFLAGIAEYERSQQEFDRLVAALDRREPALPGFTVAVDETGEFEPIHTEALPVTGKDGYGCKTPTVRELAALLAAIPEQLQDLPVSRYCDEGVCGISYRLHYEHEESGNWTAHVGLW